MSDGERKLKKIWDAETRRPKAADGGLGHDELRDRWLELYPDIAFGGGEWRKYADGWWQPIEDLAVEAQVMDVLERSRDEGVKITRHLLGSVLKLGQLSVYVPREKWDADPDILVLANGALEVSSRRFREHRPEDYATSALPYDYDPDADCEVFRAVVGKAAPDAVGFLQEFAGYCLTPNTSLETALWFKGPRGSGKSTVIEGLVAMLGDKHGVLGLGEIESSPFALSRIPGKTLLVSTEQPSSYLRSTHVIDALISGESIIMDRKHRDAEEVTPTAKIVWAMNEAPRIANTTSGIFRRVKIVEFPAPKGKRDPAVKEWVKAEGPGILNWAIEGLVRLRERGGFEFPESVISATTEFEKSNDIPAQFVEEQCIVAMPHEVASNILYSRYKGWCEDNGHRPMSNNRIGEEWKRLGFTPFKGSGGRRFWKGLMTR
jgi:putative DNA primase/helicase